MNNFITLIKHSLMSREGIIFIEQEIKLLFNLIEKTKCMEDAKLLFSNLEDI